MKEIGVKRIVLSSAMFCLTVTSVYSQLFFTVVYDPTNYANAVLRYHQLQAQTSYLHNSYWQAVDTYLQLVQEYEHFQKMARQLPGKDRYRFGTIPWGKSEAENVLGTSGPWSRAINTGLDVAESYRQAIEELRRFEGLLASIPADQQRRIRTRYATVELADAANLHAMELLGRLRERVPVLEQAVEMLGNDTLSSLDEFNTEIAVLNKINAAGVVNLRASHDTNKLLIALLEQQITESKQRRDSRTAAVNAHIAFQEHGARIGFAGLEGTTEVIANFRFR